jgi:hypothetical protein
MILVNDVIMIRIDGAKDKTVNINKISTVEFKEPVSPSKESVKPVPPLPVTLSLAFGALSVAPYSVAFDVNPKLKDNATESIKTESNRLALQYSFFIFLIIMPTFLVNDL